MATVGDKTAQTLLMEHVRYGRPSREELAAMTTAALSEARRNERLEVVKKVEAWRSALGGDVDGLIHAIREPGDE